MQLKRQNSSSTISGKDFWTVLSSGLGIVALTVIMAPISLARMCRRPAVYLAKTLRRFWVS